MFIVVPPNHPRLLQIILGLKPHGDSKIPHFKKPLYLLQDKHSQAPAIWSPTKPALGLILSSRDLRISWGFPGYGGGIPSSEQTWPWKTTIFCIGKSTETGPFSIAILNDQRCTWDIIGDITGTSWDVRPTKKKIVGNAWNFHFYGVYTYKMACI